MSPDRTPSGTLMQAKREVIAVDPARTAVIVVDMQNDFGAKGGMFDLLETLTELARRLPMPRDPFSN